MEWVNAKIASKISHAGSHLYQDPHVTNDFPLDYSKFWLSYAEFEVLQQKYPYFSSNPLISGILFSKRRENKQKSQWFQSKFFTLFKDRLILHSVKQLNKENMYSNRILEKRLPSLQKSSGLKRRALEDSGRVS